MKNGNFKLIGGLVVGMIIGGATIVGANQYIQAMQNTEIKVSLNGQVQEFKDETTGEIQYPITYNNRTYLPLRNVAQLSGLDVDYDTDTNTAILFNDDYSGTKLEQKRYELKDIVFDNKNLVIDFGENYQDLNTKYGIVTA